MSACPQIKPVPPPPDFFTVREAAEAAGKSTTWIRNRIVVGLLERHSSDGGPTLVTSESVAALLRERERRREQRNQSRRRSRRSHLRLVIDNGKGRAARPENPDNN